LIVGARVITAFGTSLLLAGFWFRRLPHAVDPDQVARTRHRLLKDALRDPDSRKLANYDKRMHAMEHRLPLYSRWMMIVGAAIAATGIVTELTGLLPAM